MASEFSLDHHVLVALAAVLGLIFGSFVTALSYRLPRGEKISHGRSRCPACGHPLGLPDLVPLLSWVAGAGACRYCRARISVRYPLIEGLSLATFTATALAIHEPARLALTLAFLPALIALAVIDFEYQRLPDSLILVLALLALAWRWSTGGHLLSGFIDAVVVLAALLAIDFGHRHFKGESGIGFGDTKLITAMALGLPLVLFLVAVALASGTGIPLALWWRRRTGRERFPFGINLVSAWWLALLVPPALVSVT